MDLSQKYTSELLKLKRDAHYLVLLSEMIGMWDSTLKSTINMECYLGQKAFRLWSKLMDQSKAFVESRHEGNMNNMAR